MKKVLHYVTIMNRAGEETFIMNVFRTIDREKVMFDFLVSSSKEGDYDSEIRNLGGYIRHINFGLKKSRLNRIKKFCTLYNCLKECSENYHVFHIHTQHAMDALLDSLAAKFAGMKLVIVHSHSTQTLFHKNAHYICRPFLNFMPIYRFACSDEAGKWLFGKNGKYEIITNGIVTDYFLYDQENRNKVRKAEGWGTRTVIGHVGSFTYPKNHTFLINIFNEYLKYDKNAILAMAGKGELMYEIKKQVDDLGINESVVFLGGRADVNELYSAFDALVFPSHYEGLPVTLVEAQASGLPCLISDTITTETDITSLVKRLGLDLEPDIWARNLNSILKSKERKNNKELIERSGFDIKSTSLRLLDVYLSR